MESNQPTDQTGVTLMADKLWIKEPSLYNDFVTTRDLSELSRHLEKGGTPNIYCGLTSLLHAAADLGSLEAVDLLLAYGADPDGIPDRDAPVPALLIATSKGHVDIVRRLLEAGANVNARDIQGDTAILRARAMDHLDIAEILLREGANPTLENLGGSSAVKGGRYYAETDRVGDLLRSRGYPAEQRQPRRGPWYTKAAEADSPSRPCGMDLVREMRTSAPNYDLSNDDILSQLRRWDQQYGIEILDVGGDLVRVLFLSLPDPVEPLAEEINRFCPDVVDQGFGCFQEMYGEMLDHRDELPHEVAQLIEGVDLDEEDYGLAILANALRRDRTVSLWWD